MEKRNTNKTVKKVTTKSPKKKKKKKRGFTLIELLAVIVILGLLMAIAIPSITRYITQSRRKTVVSSIDGYVSSVVNSVNDQDYNFTASNTIYAIPIECISLEKGGTNPFGEWLHANDEYWAYVLVQYDSEDFSYTYGFTFKDSAGYGMYPTAQSAIDSKSSTQIKTGLELTKPESGPYTNIAAEKNWNGFNISNETQVVVLEAEKENVPGDGKTTCTLCQKGDNYIEVGNDKEEDKQKTLSSLATGGTENQACAKKGQICSVTGKGTLFTIKVNGTETKNFYVIADDGEKLSLIMDSNLGENVEWYKDERNSDYGPVTALIALQDRTKTWTNLPQMEIDSFETYDGLNISSKKIAKSYTMYARLPKYSELAPLGTGGSNLYVTYIPSYLYENPYGNGNSVDADYSGFVSDSHWTLTSGNSSIGAFAVYYDGMEASGVLSSNYVDSTSFGIRPVIELYK